MLVRFTKSPAAAKTDRLTCVRPDGSKTSMDMRRQGILPHEAFHFVIETTLRWHDAFFGQVSRGAALDQTTQRFHGRQEQWAKLPQAFQAEALIECLEAEQWGGASDPADFALTLVNNCRRRAVPPPDIDAEELERVRVALREFGALWRPLAAGESIERRFTAA